MRPVLKPLWFACTVIVLAGLSVMPANADEIRPALLDIKERNTGLFAVTWKVPTRGDRVLAITPQLPDSLELLGSPTVQDVPGARIEHAAYKNNGESLTGQTIVIDGLNVSNWLSPAVYQSLHTGGVTAINATIAIWDDFESTINAISSWYEIFEQNSDLVIPVRTVDDIHEAQRSGRCGVIFGWQNATPIGTDLRRLRLFHELGVRIALGAGSGKVQRLVLRQGLSIALMGVAIGVGGALIATRFLARMLYGVSATDPVTFVGVAVLLTGVAVLASYLPARKASAIEPTVALRSE